MWYNISWWGENKNTLPNLTKVRFPATTTKGQR
jgi:hypothetical protein